MSSSRAFKDAATALLAGGSSFSRIRSITPSTTLRHVRATTLGKHQRASTTTTTATARRGYASISTNTTQPPAYIDSTAGLTPGARVIIATTRGVRNVLIFATSTLGLVLFAFTGAHAYLEQYKCPSPQGVSTEVQRCLHGAWVREEVSPDPDVAELYFQKAVELARKDLETHYANKNKGKKEGGIMDERLAFLEIEKDQALVEIQHRLARFYGRIGRDEQAATVWTRLWKLSEKENPRPHSSGQSSSSGLGSLFGGAGVDRPLISQKDGIPYAKSAADCWMRMGEYEMAEEALAWTLSTLASTSTTSSSSSPTRIEEIGLLSTLGALYVRQAKFEYALSLFVKALQAVQDHRASQTDEATTTADEKKKAALKEDKDMWYCREAILTQSIGETLYGAATRSPASSTSSSSTTTTPTAPATTETKKSSSWKFWSSSSSTTSTSSTQSKAVAQQQQKSPEQVKKVEEALGWMQKALTMAKAKSGQHRDCDECAALGLNNLGLINEMEGKREVALAQFKEAVLHATMAKDYVGIDDYNRNIARLTDQINSDSESTSTPA